MPSSTPTPHQLQSSSITLEGNAVFALLQSFSSAGAWSLDLASGALLLSTPLRRLLEIDDEVLGPANIDDIYAPASISQMSAAHAACKRHGTPFDNEAWIATRRGKQLRVRTAVAAVRDSSGTIVGMQGAIQDIDHQQTGAPGLSDRTRDLPVNSRHASTSAVKGEAFATLDSFGCFLALNDEASLLLERPAQELLERELWSHLTGSSADRLRQEMQAVIATGHSTEFEEFHAPLNKWLEMRMHPDGEGVAVYFRDVTGRRRSLEQLLLLQTSISRLNDIVVITEASLDEPGPRIVFVNDAFERLTGYSQHEVLGQTPRILQGRRTQPAELERIRKALHEGQPVRAELINYKKNGELFWMELDIVPVDYFNRGLTHWVAVGRDITQRKASEDEIEHLAFYDALTQLPNRQLLMDRLERAVAAGQSGPRVGALMFIDLDHFKILNDTLGHSRGDMLLQQVAERLGGCMRLSDTVARLGGDEFVVMIEDLKESVEHATVLMRQVGEKILATLSEPYDLAGHQHHGTCSIGITLFTEKENHVGELLKQADLAMYQAKGSGRNAVCFFDPGMQAVATANAALSTQLRQGLREREFVLHYQPQVGRKGKMFGVEALVRWHHPQQGLVFPDQFIPQAEDSGLILPLGQWVLETACIQLAAWAGRPETADISIAVNVSARQFRHPEFVELVLSLIERHGVRPKCLKLELTESLLATGMDITIAKMGLLKSAGVTLSIDDFGMGYSALSYLKYLPLDQLKIDRTFVKDILTDPNDAAIARTIIGLAQSLGLGVIAEGVENEAQREWLERYGCECYQGHLYCKALPVDALEDFLAVQAA